MYDFLRIFLPAYFIFYFAIAFVVKSIIVSRRIGKSAFVIPKDDSAYGLIGFYFKMTLIIMFIYVLMFAVAPGIYHWFLPVNQLNSFVIKYIGTGLLIIAFIWTVVAQKDMKNSWRIGIDSTTKTELITTGLFRFSRNPIFFGMILSLIGLFLTTPNAATLLFLIVGTILIQIQIRLEEEFLVTQHSKKYLEYKQKVRRLI